MLYNQIIKTDGGKVLYLLAPEIKKNSYMMLEVYNYVNNEICALENHLPLNTTALTTLGAFKNDTSGNTLYLYNTTVPGTIYFYDDLETGLRPYIVNTMPNMIYEQKCYISIDNAGNYKMWARDSNGLYHTIDDQTTSTSVDVIDSFNCGWIRSMSFNTGKALTMILFTPSGQQVHSFQVTLNVGDPLDFQHPLSWTAVDNTAKRAYTDMLSVYLGQSASTYEERISKLEKKVKDFVNI